MESFFDPNTEVDGRPLTHILYENILKDQVQIAYYSKGGISVEDTDALCPNDRNLIKESIIGIKQAEVESLSPPNNRTSRY